VNTIKGYINRVMFFLVLATTASLSYGNEMDLMYEFQLDQLLDPSAEQLLMEREGQVFVYHGLKDSDIQLALDVQQHRMHSMMFVNVVWTDESGQPIIDPYTGQIVTDDDC